jgi:hypothetical protein
MNKPMYSVIESVTPERAAAYLELNISNRPVRENWVTQLARMLSSGQFILHHQGIAFDTDGFLLDGQHRLLAIVRSGVSVDILVTRNVTTAAKLSMDDHQRRSVADSMSLARREMISGESIAVVRAALEYAAALGGQSNRYTKSEINATYDAFVPALEWVMTAIPSRVEKGVSSATTKAAVMLAWYYCDLDRLTEFTDILTGRVMPTSIEDRAAVILREALLKAGMKNNSSRAEFFRKTQRAIKAFMAREELQRLYAVSDACYPWPPVKPVRTGTAVVIN